MVLSRRNPTLPFKRDRDHTGWIAAMELIRETEIVCPHCGESFPLQIDTSQSEQSLVEDCTVCCRPISLTIYCRPGEIESVSEAAG
jgi:hypothetical protein